MQKVEVLLVEFEVHPAHVPDFAAAIAVNARASLDREPGCRRFDVCTDPADATRFVLYELYDDTAAVLAHLASDHFGAFEVASAPWVKRKQVRRLRL